MGKAAAPQIVALIRDELPLRDQRSIETRRLAQMPRNSETPSVGKSVKPDRQRRAGRPHDVGWADVGFGYVGWGNIRDIRLWCAGVKDMADHTAALRRTGGKVKPNHDTRAFMPASP